MKNVLLGGAALSLAVAFSGTAYAQNSFTDAGVTVTNSFTVDYSANSVSQTQITSNTVEYTVDRLVDLTVTYISATDDSEVAPTSQDADLIYKIVNDGNDNFAYLATATNRAADDDFDVSNIEVDYYVDDGDGVFQPGGVDGNPIDFTGASPDLAPNAVLWVRVIADIPPRANPEDQVEGTTSDVLLLATAAFPTTWIEEGVPGSAGSAVTADDGTAADGGNAENVFADNGNANAASDADNDGKHSAYGTYTISDPDLLATKSVVIISSDLDDTFDCVSGAIVANQYATPGACVEYEISLENRGTADATSVAISDTLDNNLIFWGSTQTNVGGTFAALASNTDCAASACVVSLTGGTVAAGQTGIIKIRASIK